MTFILRRLKNLIWGPFFTPGKRAVLLYRASHWCHVHRLKVFSLILFNLNHILHGCEIRPSAQIGKGFVIPHTCGIVIGEGVIMGDECMVFQNVTIGKARPEIEGDDYPIIGNGVKVYLGASILGKVKIGDGTRIGAHSLVLSDVPANSLAVGVPARIKPN